MSDQATNSSHAQHYIDAAAQAHKTIVRLRAELLEAQAENDRLGRLVIHLSTGRARV